MKFYHFLIFSFGILLFLNCNKDDEDNTLKANCCSENPYTVTTVKGINFFIPNYFTANSNGANDLFFLFQGPDTSGLIQNISLSISLDGNEIFSITNVQGNNSSFAWDGTGPDNQLVNSGLYEYQFEVEFNDSSTTTLYGKVCTNTGWEIGIDCTDCALGTQHDGKGGFDENLETFEGDACK